MYDTTLNTLLDQHFGRFGRSLIGFEPTFKRLSNATSFDNAGYPPYNLERISDQQYRITLAVAGFQLNELDITLADNKLTITGNTSNRSNNHNREMVHKGIAERNFTRSFVLADHVIVKGAVLEHGLLTIDLNQEVPEALKPRKISIDYKGGIESASSNSD
jgi:molecular chaperone IbpA